MLRAIRSRFKKSEVCIISQDDYYKDRAIQQRDRAGYRNFDLPSSLDLDAFERDLRMVLDGETVSRHRYDFNKVNFQATDLIFSPSPVVVVEGLFLGLNESISSLIDYTVYLHAEENLKLIRRISRDINERNYQLDEILHRYQHHVMPSFAKYIGHWRENADLVINNNDSFDKGLKIILAFVQSLIDQNYTT